jgi:pantothenate kinase
LDELLVPLLASGRRIMVGMAGPPGVGKSTLAHALAAASGAGAVVVPMDGFHLSNMELERLGLANRKGAPETFDAAGFVHLLRRIRVDEPLVYAPAFDRTVNESIGGAIAVPAHVRLVIVEGNYLLLDRPPWHDVAKLLDLTVYLDMPDEDRRRGLIDRQRARGLDEAAAVDWVMRSDEANADLVKRTRTAADIQLHRSA